jgi:hypothetical protein
VLQHSEQISYSFLSISFGRHSLASPQRSQMIIRFTPCLTRRNHTSVLSVQLRRRSPLFHSTPRADEHTLQQFALLGSPSPISPAALEVAEKIPNLVGLGFTGCRKTPGTCHPERSEGSAFAPSRHGPPITIALEFLNLAVFLAMHWRMQTSLLNFLRFAPTFSSVRPCTPKSPFLPMS